MNVPLINGNWIQTIAEMLYAYITSSANTFSATTDVIVSQNVYLPQQTITVVSNQNAPLPHRQPTVVFQNNTIQPPPRIITITNTDLKLRLCGSPSNNSIYVGCVNCIDNQLANNPQSSISDCNHCKDAGRRNNKCVNGQMIMGRCYCK